MQFLKFMVKYLWKNTLTLLKNLKNYNKIKEVYDIIYMGGVIMDKEIIEILKRLESKIDRIEIKQDETYQIVKALEHSAEVNKAEHDKMANDILYIKGDVEGLRKDISTVEIVTANNYADIAKLKAVK